MAQAVLLLLQFFQLSSLQVCFVQQFVAVLNIIRILLALLGQVLQLTQGLYSRYIRPVMRAIIRPQGFVLCDRIQYFQLEIRVLDEQIRVLRVDINQFVGQYFQLLQGHYTVVHERTTLAVSV